MANEIVLYQPNDQLSLEVKVENDTVWLNRNQMAVLFDRDVKTIGKHINNALHEELAPTVAKNATLHVYLDEDDLYNVRFNQDIFAARNGDMTISN